MTALALSLALGVAIGADDAPTVTKATPTAKESAPASKEAAAGAKAPLPALRLQKKAKTAASAPEKGAEAPTSDAAEPKRNIPTPDQLQKRSELDEQLLDKLGANLERVEDADSDPLLRAGRNMRAVEEKLARLEANETTSQLQQQIVKDLEELLKQAQNRKNQGGSSASRKNQQRQQQQMRLAQQQQQRAPGQKDGQARTAAQGATRGAVERMQTGEAAIIKDVWGHLSAALRQEMSQYAKESFLPAYRDLLERYYSTISKSGKEGGGPGP